MSGKEKKERWRRDRKGRARLKVGGDHYVKKMAVLKGTLNKVRGRKDAPGPQREDRC